MLNKKLQVDQWNEMSYQLLKLLVKQQKNPGISAAGTKVNAAGMKVTTAERLQLLEEFLLSLKITTARKFLLSKGKDKERIR
ncbi:hypothetical protein Tco_1457321 [Tanacetum coccineum]